MLKSPGLGGGEGLVYERDVRMLFVSLRGVNFGFWSHIGWSGENDIICSPYVAVKVSFRVSREEI